MYLTICTYLLMYLCMQETCRNQTIQKVKSKTNKKRTNQKLLFLKKRREPRITLCLEIKKRLVDTHSFKKRLAIMQHILINIFDARIHYLMKLILIL